MTVDSVRSPLFRLKHLFLKFERKVGCVLDSRSALSTLVAFADCFMETGCFNE